MLKFILPLAVMSLAISASAAEYRIDFGLYPQGQCPSNFVSVLSGEGKMGDWKIVEQEVDPLIAPISPEAPKTAKRAVLTQTVPDATNERFPILLWGEDTFGDFTLTTSFRIVGGSENQMAGVVFRATDEKNYYVICASAADNYVRFYKSVGNIRSTPIGKKTSIRTNAWHELKVTCKGTEIRCMIDGQEALPALNDTSFSAGKIGFWTKSDSIAQFVDTHIDYTPRIPIVQKMVRNLIKKYPRVLGVKVYGSKNGGSPRILASDKEDELGTLGGQVETDTIQHGTIYYLKNDKSVEVTVPLRDKDGEVAAALRLIMRTFPGETRDNAVARAGVLNKELQKELGAVTDLNE